MLPEEDPRGPTMLYAALDRCLESLELAPTEALGVAVSGGRDSMTLAELARRRLGRRVFILHVDHQARADSSDDAAFVADWARRHELRCLQERLDGHRLDEAGLREGRYRVLEGLRVEAELRWVLLGHHRDDQAETLLMRLLTRGRLEPMPGRRGAYVRPFIRVSSEVIARYAARHGLVWREDSSNRDPRFLRNRLRRELIPLIEQVYRPGFRRRLVAEARRRGGFSPRISDWPSAVGPDAAVFDADQVKTPCYRPIGTEDDWSMELGASFRVLRERGAWIVADGERLLWAPGFVALAGRPHAGTTRAWIFEWK